MRAASVERYGGPEVVRVVEVPTPTPGRDDVLVRVVAVAVTSGDARIRAARFPPGFAVPSRLVLGFRGPRRKVLGSAFSGVVERTGASVTGFSPGDEVCGMTGMRMGAHAEYLAVRAVKVVRKPPTVSHDDAAGVLFGGTTALYFLRDKASVVPGMQVLVNGASGAVGTNAVQLAKHFGATVTAVTSAGNAALVKQLGADRVVDHATEDVFALGAAGERFDAVLDAVGTLPVARARGLLTEHGKLLLVVASLGRNITARGNVVAGTSRERPADFELLLRLVADGTLTVVHDRTFDLDQVADAHRRVDTGHKVGNVILHP